jgi:hypothetical protein
MSSVPRVFVPRFVDADNVNAQNLNAKALLSHFTGPINWVALHSWSSHPDPAVANSPRVACVRLWPNRFSTAHIFLLYQERADAVFYPTLVSLDAAALHWGRRTRHVRKDP